MRHFQNIKHGWVTTPASIAAAEYASDPLYVEVQPAPLDAIVIRREDLPEVRVSKGRVHAGTEVGEDYHASVGGNAAWAWNYGLAALAVAEHLRANPPVDEGQVAALADVIYEINGVLDDDDLARALVRRGVRVEVQS